MSNGGSKIRALLEDERVQDGFDQLGRAWDVLQSAILDPKGTLSNEVQKEEETEDRKRRTVAVMNGGVTVEQTPKAGEGGGKTFCTNCGGRLIVSHKFCGSCGSKV